MNKTFLLQLVSVTHFMRLCLMTPLICCLVNNLYGQSVPEAINYQAIVRDAETYKPISDRSTYVSVEFMDGPNGEILYQEEFSSIITSKAGLINLSLGTGAPLVGIFGEISWQTKKVWMRLSVDVGEGLTILQETPFNTVPYAFYALHSGDEDQDTDSSNELQSLQISDDQLSISNSPSETSIDLSHYLDNTDNQELSFDGASLSITGSAGEIDLSSLQDGFEDADADSSNEIQDLDLTGNELTITGNASATEIDLSPYLDNTDNQDLTISGSVLSLSGDATTVDLSTVSGIGDDADLDSSNEIQDLDLTGNELTITGNASATEIDLSPYLDNTDNQDLTISGSVLSLTGDATTVDLSTVPGIGDDGDADSTNEIQDLDLTGNDLTITGNASATEIDLSSYLDNTDNQDLTISGSVLSLSGDATTVDLSTVPGIGDDGDADSTNEIQDLDLTGNDLTITGNASATEIDLSSYLDNTDNQDLTISGSVLSLSGDATTVDLSTVPGIGDDGDADSTNELQNLLLSGGFLTLTNITPAAQIDMRPYDQSDLTNGHVFIGDASDEAQEVKISGDAELNPNGALTVLGIKGRPITAAAPSGGQVLAYNATANEWQLRSPSAEALSGNVGYYSVDPLDFREIADPVIGVNLNVNNSLKFFDDHAPFAMMRDNDIIEMMAPLHLPHGSIINSITLHVRNNSTLATNRMTFAVYRKQMTNYSLTNQLVGNFIYTAGNQGDMSGTVNITTNNVVDNAMYTYRLFVRFDPGNLETSDSPSATDVAQRVYGISIAYTVN